MDPLCTLASKDKVLLQYLMDGDLESQGLGSYLPPESTNISSGIKEDFLTKIYQPKMMMSQVVKQMSLPLKGNDDSIL